MAKLSVIRNVALINRWKAFCGCKVCGEKDPRVLDLHHVDPSSKRGGVSSLAWSEYGRKSVKDEIRKCVVLCKNHHSIEHNPETPSTRWTS